MIDRTEKDYSEPADFGEMFKDLVRNDLFSKDKKADVRISADSYLNALVISQVEQDPVRLVIVDYKIWLHC